MLWSCDSFWNEILGRHHVPAYNKVQPLATTFTGQEGKVFKIFSKHAKNERPHQNPGSKHDFLLVYMHSLLHAIRNTGKAGNSAERASTQKKALCASSFVFPFLSFPNFVLKLFFFVLRTGSATSIHAEWNLLSCDQFVAHSSARARKKSIKLFTHPSPRGGPSSRVVPLKRVDRRLHNTSYCRRRGPPRWHDRRRRRNTPRSERVVTYFYDPVPPKLCLLWGCGPVAEKWFLSQWVKSALNYF